jgi:hypothetical protein
MAMSARHQILIGAGLILFTITCVLPAQTALGELDKEELTNISIREFVTRLGEKTETKYTIEYFYSLPAGGGTTLALVPISAISPAWDPKVMIEKYYPDYVVSRNKRYPNLYHVMDKRLSRVTNYALDRQLAEVRFHGPLREYPHYLTSLVSRFHAYAPGDLMDGYRMVKPVPDTQFSVSLRSISLRDAISACLDIEKSEGLCWETFSGIQKGGSPGTDFTFKRGARFKASP